jgi:hypothetical protein
MIIGKEMRSVVDKNKNLFFPINLVFLHHNHQLISHPIELLHLNMTDNVVRILYLVVHQLIMLINLPISLIKPHKNVIKVLKPTTQIIQNVSMIFRLPLNVRRDSLSHHLKDTKNRLA